MNDEMNDFIERTGRPSRDLFEDAASGMDDVRELARHLGVLEKAAKDPKDRNFRDDRLLHALRQRAEPEDLQRIAGAADIAETVRMLLELDPKQTISWISERLLDERGAGSAAATAAADILEGTTEATRLV